VTSRQSLVRWVVSVLLFAPFLLPFATHFLFPAAGMYPSGFIQPDMPYYMGNAREHFDDGGFTLTYGLPYSPSYETPRLYFQPQTLLLGAVMRVSGMDPADLYLLFGVICGVLCVRLALELFERRFGLERASQWLTATGFVWGGGLFVALGALKWLGTGDLNSLFALDPFDGMWFLNFGRNFIYPHEAYYHALWVGAVLLLAAKRYWPAFTVLVLSAASHPFTGVQLVGIVLAWSLLERVILRNRELPGRFIVATGALLLLHLGYYRVFLHTSAEHRIVEQQWISSTQDWTLNASQAIPGYALVAALALWTIRSRARAKEVFADSFARLLAVWALASIALENNEWFMSPSIQPLHFTRGYTWMALFLLGAPALIAGLDRLIAARHRVIGIAAATVCLGVLALDNAVFLTTFHRRSNVASQQMWFPPGFRELARFLSEPAQRGALFFTPEGREEPFDKLAYLLTVYTPLRTWNSHPFNTPNQLQNYVNVVNLYEHGMFQPDWKGRKLLIVFPAGSELPPWVVASGGTRVYESAFWRVHRIG
jgi:hypothetical protein